MHPLRERACDHLLQHPSLRSPPPEPEKPRPPRGRQPRVFKLLPRFPLLSKEFYACWCNHQKELQLLNHLVDDSPPSLYPELYLKPRRLDCYARQLEQNMNVNKELLKRINIIQRTGGFVNCWNPPLSNKSNKLLCKKRQNELEELRVKNLYIYKRLLTARSQQPLTKELNAMWKETRHKLILGASILLNIWVLGGSKIGEAVVELFTDLVPQTCQIFLNLIKGDGNGHGYAGTRFFRIVPNLYCRGGDVTKDNGFGCYVPEGQDDPPSPESLDLKHSVPGVLSMAITTDNEVYGQFNIIFKPLPQFDKKHVVFGRVIGGPMQMLERISAQGLPLGTTTSDCVIRSCGWYTRAGHLRQGAPNTVKFPPRRKKA